MPMLRLKRMSCNQKSDISMRTPIYKPFAEQQLQVTSQGQPMARVLIETYGCTLNQADSDIMESVLRQRGHSVERGEYDASSGYDCVIVNTCTVKTPTEQRILDRLVAMQSLGPRLVVAGCMAGANRERVLRRVPGASLVTPSNVHRIGDAVAEATGGTRVEYLGYGKTDKPAYLGNAGRVIARIPISEGCTSACSFCETRFARGPLKSYPHRSIIEAVGRAVASGAREIELTSQDVGAYGADRKTDIAELVADASSIEGSFKMRIGMLNPFHLNRYMDRLIEAYKSPKVYKFIHLPVQSGSDRVLKAMRRGYTAGEFREQVLELRARVPDISIATDVIVGYPSETEEDFEMSMELLAETRPSRTNISKFGARPHAEASRLARLDNGVVKSRTVRMYRTARKIEVEALTAVVGERRRVLVTERNGESLLARDDSYREIAVAGNGIRLGDAVDVEIVGSSSACLLANVIGEGAPLSSAAATCNM